MPATESRHVSGAQADENQALADPGASTAAKPQRRDAQRNRRRIIDAAREVFALEGVAAGLNDVARHAGLGVATVYRHFPDKEVLVQAALQQEADNLLELMDEGLAAESAWDGLAHVFQQSVAMNVACRGLRDVAFGSGFGEEHVDAFRDALAPRMAELLSRAREQGAVRPDITPADLVMIMLTLTEFAQRSIATQPEAYRRYLELALNSLHANSYQGKDLEVPLSQGDAQEIAKTWN